MLIYLFGGIGKNTQDESEDIFIGEKATIYTSAQIIGLAYIGKSTKIGI